MGLSGKTRSLELRDADMYALDLASEALGKVMGANGAMRLLSAQIESEAPEDRRSSNLPRYKQTKNITVKAKLRNPFGDTPLAVLVEVGLVRHKDHERDSWPAWKMQFLTVRDKEGKHIKFFHRGQEKE